MSLSGPVWQQQEKIASWEEKGKFFKSSFKIEIFLKVFGKSSKIKKFVKWSLEKEKFCQKREKKVLKNWKRKNF